MSQTRQVTQVPCATAFDDDWMSNGKKDPPIGAAVTDKALDALETANQAQASPTLQNRVSPSESQPASPALSVFERSLSPPSTPISSSSAEIEFDKPIANDPEKPP